MIEVSIVILIMDLFIIIATIICIIINIKMEKELERREKDYKILYGMIKEMREMIECNVLDKR